MKPNLAARAARWSASHRKAAILGWIAFVLASVVIGGAVGMNPLKDEDSGAGSSGRADQVIAASFPDEAEEMVFVQSKRHTARDPQFRSVVDDVGARIARQPGVTDVKPGAVSKDGHSQLVEFTLPGEREKADGLIPATLAATAAAQRAHPEFRVEQFGDASAEKAIVDSFDKDFQKAEVLSLPVTALILLFAFGSIVAAGLPLLLAMSAVAATIGLGSIVSQFSPMPDAAASVVLLVGLAVGVDYSLFYLRREREERAAGKGEEAALAAAAATSGRAVLVSGITVMIAMAGMYLSGSPIFIGMATGAILVVGVALIASLTVLPALLSKLGDRVEKGRIPIIGRRRSSDSRAWGWVLTRVLRRPVVSTVIAGGVLVALAIPAFSMHTAVPGMESFSRDLAVMQTYDRIQAAFPGNAIPAVAVVQADDVTKPAVKNAIADLREQAVAGGHFNEPVSVEISKDRTVAAVAIPIDGDGSDPRSEAAVRDLRDRVIPATVGRVDGAEVNVAGVTAGTMDFNALMKERVPIVFAFVLALAFALLLVTFRSIVVPVKAIALNLLSVGAAYGVLKIVFQDIRGEAITSWLPLFLFVILFGLSMDYHVFILARVREAVDRGMRTEDAVAHGIRSTAGVVTSAAMVMVAVFAIFGTLQNIEFKQMGVGLAVAILIDATIVRAVLLPAAMKLLGERNWYLPRKLQWLPRVEHEGAVEPAVA